MSDERFLPVPKLAYQRLMNSQVDYRTGKFIWFESVGDKLEVGVHENTILVRVLYGANGQESYIRD